MLDKRTAVADNDDLMRAAALVVISMREIVWLYREAFAVGKLAALQPVSGSIGDLSKVLDRIDFYWEAHYGK